MKEKRIYLFGREIYFKLFGWVYDLLQPKSFAQISKGKDFPDKHFLLIRRNDVSAGLFSQVLYVLGWTLYAVENQMIPVVDLQNRRNLYLRRSEVGKVNAWELFFEQPCGYSLSDIARAKNITVVDGDSLYPKYGIARCFEYQEKNSEEWRMIQDAAVRYLKPKRARKENKDFEKALSESVVLGVLARGTDYVTMRPKGHSVQPTMEQFEKKIRELDESGQAKIYLVTEDAGVKKWFLENYGDRMILSNQKPLHYSDGFLVDSKDVACDRERAWAYFNAIADLARCPRLIAGKTSGSIGAAILSPATQQRFFFELGVYP